MSGPVGYLSEGLRQNLALQSQTFDNTAWVLSNALDMNAVVADQYVATDGTTTMDKVQPKNTNAGHYLFQQAITQTTGTTYTLSYYLKYISQRWIAIDFNDGVTNNYASFDLLNGVVGAVSAGVTSTIASTAISGVYRVSMTVASGNSSANGKVFIVLNDIDSASQRTWLAAGTELLGVWGAQLEAASFASTYIPTTTVAVTRNAEIDQGVSAGNVPTNDFVVYGETVWPVIPNAASYFLWASYVDASNYTAVLWDGTNLIARKRIGGANHDATKALTPVAGTRYKWAGRFTSTTGTDIFHSGAIGTNDATNTACQIGAAFQIGADGNGANQPYADNSNSRIYPKALPTSKLTALTT